VGLFDLFSSKNEDSRRSYLKELIKVAKADGRLEKREYDFILAIGQRLSCSPEEVEQLSNQVPVDSSEDSQHHRKQRLKLLFDTVAIMMIDDDIDPKELNLCKSIAMKSGFEHQVIDDIVYRINTLTKAGKSVEEACEEAFQVYNQV